MKQVLNSRAKEFKKTLNQSYSKYQEKCADDLTLSLTQEPFGGLLLNIQVIKK
jgi:hypothetical protein